MLHFWNSCRSPWKPKYGAIATRSRRATENIASRPAGVSRRHPNRVMPWRRGGRVEASELKPGYEGLEDDSDYYRDVVERKVDARCAVAKPRRRRRPVDGYPQYAYNVNPGE